MEITEVLNKEIEEFKEDMVQLCADLVKIPSETPHSDTKRRTGAEYGSTNQQRKAWKKTGF